MAIVTAMIPAGFGPEKKARFISETKNALCEAFDLIPHGDLPLGPGV